MSTSKFLSMILIGVILSAVSILLEIGAVDPFWIMLWAICCVLTWAFTLFMTIWLVTRPK